MKKNGSVKNHPFCSGLLRVRCHRSVLCLLLSAFGFQLSEFQSFSFFSVAPQPAANYPPRMKLRLVVEHDAETKR